ncbi:hypothetical protein M378DRAFT_170617 [Amanita muscaria Koide BX008]|uniref:Uncharacterized protein n=1 Tax=Amanita muscaria (strain Koide BX008) TaxID=946122 RepID=A0A0C2WQD2_AMAMK|nr:hypothetical protein M378DRAFT_170617 [Amanita muscaria Koide BX008]
MEENSIKELAKLVDVMFRCGDPADAVVVILPFAQINGTKFKELHSGLVVRIDINVMLIEAITNRDAQ